MNLHHHTLLTGISVSDLRDTVAWTPNLQENLLVDILLRRGDHQLGLLEVSCGSSREVGLVLLALGVSKVGAFIGVERQTESTLERAKVVA